MQIYFLNWPCESAFIIAKFKHDALVDNPLRFVMEVLGNFITLTILMWVSFGYCGLHGFPHGERL